MNRMGNVLSCKSSWTICGAGVLFLLSVFLGCRALLSLSDAMLIRGDKPVQSGKRYVRPVAEGVRMSRHGIYGVDLVSCGSCRIEKRRRGPLSFGGSNVLVMEDLSVTLPSVSKSSSKGGTSHADDAPSSPRDVAQRLGLTKDFLSTHNVPLKFSGLNITKLEVGRLDEDGKTVTRLFGARAAESCRGGLDLRGCAVTLPSGKVANVGRAMLAITDNAMRLVWRGGEMKL